MKAKNKCHVSGKIIHFTKASAEEHVRWMKTQGRPFSRYYICVYCNAFHATSKAFKTKES
jgi:hypothetical protein